MISNIAHWKLCTKYFVLVCTKTGDSFFCVALIGHSNSVYPVLFTDSLQLLLRAMPDSHKLRTEWLPSLLP